MVRPLPEVTSLNVDGNIAISWPGRIRVAGKTWDSCPHQAGCPTANGQGWIAADALPRIFNPQSADRDRKQQDRR